MQICWQENVILNKNKCQFRWISIPFLVMIIQSTTQTLKSCVHLQKCYLWIIKNNCDFFTHNKYLGIFSSSTVEVFEPQRVSKDGTAHTKTYMKGINPFSKRCTSGILQWKWITVSRNKHIGCQSWCKSSAVEGLNAVSKERSTKECGTMAKNIHKQDSYQCRNMIWQHQKRGPRHTLCPTDVPPLLICPWH